TAYRTAPRIRSCPLTPWPQKRATAIPTASRGPKTIRPVTICCTVEGRDTTGVGVGSPATSMAARAVVVSVRVEPARRITPRCKRGPFRPAHAAPRRAAALELRLEHLGLHRLGDAAHPEAHPGLRRT